MKIKNFKIGADIEAFLTDASSAYNERIINAENIIQGTKDEPFKLKGFRYTSLDNILCEYSINPCVEEQEFQNEIAFMDSWTRSHVQSINPNYNLLYSASARVSEEILNTPNSRILGCSEDLNVYTKSVNEKPQGESTNLRSTGFHIHVSWEKANTLQLEELIQAMDLFLALPAMFIEPDSERRQLYGKAGSFRPKIYDAEKEIYGGEYRCMSGWWAGSPERISFMWNGTQQAINFVNSNEIVSLGFLADIINQNDKARALEVMASYQINLPQTQF